MVVTYDAQADVYVAFDPILDVYSQGTTEKEARIALEDAIQLLRLTEV